ncbi:MAG: tRNA (N6-threonylcarbamoyladenosine(37)-N6)-methyltransferase TrmO [Lawsonibacter sp.]|nr:tRNA (N6-threonylcarbamoyladenosine(37)-N6)-methyltransferase TrmO [Lawsonibacter sp.]
MEGNIQLQVIARIRSDFPAKFGIPRQSGLVEELEAQIIFEPEFRNEAALRGLEGFSHLWLIWEFSKSKRDEWSPTVRPPRLGGNQRLGVFATRSPFRPNPIGLSCIRLIGIDLRTAQGPVLRVSGADLMDGTPIYDIKPYLPYADCKPEAIGGFAARPKRSSLHVEISKALFDRVPKEKQAALEGVLAQDPRPSYQDDPQRVYGMEFAGLEIRFRVEGDQLMVCDICPKESDEANLPVEKEP